GPNGAGKSTLINLTCGVLQPDRGNVYLHGKNLTRLRPHEALRRGIGRTFQEVRPFHFLSTLENVQMAFPREQWENPWRVLFSLSRMGPAERQSRKRAMALLERVGLAGEAERPARELPFGQQKLLALARLMATESEVLLLDEPTTGLEPALIPQVSQIVTELAQAGKTVLIVEHDVDVVQQVCSWVVVLQSRVIAQGTCGEVLRNELVIREYLGRLYGA
ncbi:MAG: ATP-binding cassette domain-containing protein, partial [Chloroflexota bacterium]|nr:ATP-binding cassette domain-containing protein [Chloroflexota bacterium]